MSTTTKRDRCVYHCFAFCLQFDAKRRASPDPEIVPLVEESRKSAGLLKVCDVTYIYSSLFLMPTLFQCCSFLG